MQKANPQEMPQKYKELLSILRPGAEQALSSTEITKLIGMHRRDTSAITAELVIKFGYLIGVNRSQPFGYYIIENELELKTTLRALNNEAQGIMERHKGLYLNLYKE